MGRVRVLSLLCFHLHECQAADPDDPVVSFMRTLDKVLAEEEIERSTKLAEDAEKAAADTVAAAIRARLGSEPADPGAPPAADVAAEIDDPNDEDVIMSERVALDIKFQKGDTKMAGGKHLAGQNRIKEYNDTSKTQYESSTKVYGERELQFHARMIYYTARPNWTRMTRFINNTKTQQGAVDDMAERAAGAHIDVVCETLYTVHRPRVVAKCGLDENVWCPKRFENPDFAAKLMCLG